MTEGELTIDTLRKIYAMVKELNARNVDEIAKIFQYMLSLVVNNDLNPKKKKPINDAIKSIISTNSVISLFNHSRQAVEKLIDTMFNLQEHDGLKLMKAFNLLLANHSQALKPEIQNIFRTNYHDWLLRNLDRFRDVMENIGTQNQRFTVLTNQEQNLKVKSVLFKDSIVINEEVLNNAISAIDKSFPHAEYVRDALQRIVQLFLRLRLESIKAAVDELYFVDILNLVSRGLAFFSGILAKPPNITHGGINVIASVAQFIESQREQGSDLVLLLLDFLNNIPSYLTRLKVEAFDYIKVFFDKYPETMTKNLRRMLQDNFFLNSAKIKFSEIEINKIYYYWISTHKSLIKSYKKILIDSLDITDAFMLIENNINILFEENIYPNYLLNLLHNIGNLCDILKEKKFSFVGNSGALGNTGSLNPANLKTYANHLMLFLKKLLNFLKQSRKSIEDLVNHLRTKAQAQSAPSKIKSLEELSVLPREEILRRLATNGERVLQEELIMRDTFLSKYYPRTLIQHSFNIELDKNYKLESFLEDSIVKKIGILNDIIIKYMHEYFKTSLLLQPERVIRAAVDGKPVYFVGQLNFAEENILRTIYSNNLKVFKILLCNAKYLEYDNIYDNIKFSTVDYLLLKGCHLVSETRDGQPLRSYTDVMVCYRDMHKLFEQSADKLLLTFREIYGYSPENYISFYSLFIDLFSGSGILESGAKLDSEMMICARRANQAFNEVLINRIVRILQRQRLEYYSIYFREGVDEFSTFAIKILKGIYRKIKYRDNSQGGASTIIEDVMDIKEATFRLVLVIMEKAYYEQDIMSYLHLMRSIFTTVHKIPEFCRYFTEEVTSKGIKLVGFYTSLFSSNYQELKIIAVELFVFSPFDVKRVLKTEIKRVNDAHRFFDLLEFALELPDNPTIIKTLQLLEQLLVHLDKNEMRIVLNNRIDSIFRKWSNLLKNKENKFYIFKKNLQNDSQKLKMTVKIIGKYAELLNMARELTTFNIKKEIDDTERLSFDFLDEAGNLILNGLDVRSFVEVLYKELKELKQRPWFNHFYSISISFMSLFTNKHKKGLEILYTFLMNLIGKLDEGRIISKPHQETFEIEKLVLTREDCGKLYEKTFECLFSVLFFIYPFKITESPSNYEEMNSFLGYLDKSIQREPEIRGLILRLFMNNLMLSLELSNDDIDWTIFNLAKDFIQTCIAEGPLYIEVFIAELVAVFTKGNIYSINAGLYLFKMLVLDKFESSAAIRNYVLANHPLVVHALIFAFRFVDKKFELRINANFKDALKRFVDLIWHWSPNDSRLEELFADLRNFEDYDLFMLALDFEKRHSPGFPIFVNITDVICKQINSYLKTIKNYEEDRSTLWTFGFQQHVKLLLCKLIYAVEKGLYRQSIAELRDDFTIIVQFITTLKDEVMTFDRRERDYKGSTVVYTLRDPANQDEQGQQQIVDNQNVYYTNYDLKIHVDMYDYIIREFSIITEKCAELVSKIFPRISPEPAADGNSFNAQNRSEYEKMKESCFNKMLEICLRVERRSLKAILPILHLIYSHEARSTRSEHIANFKILLRFFQKNEIGENNLHIISKLVKSYPKLINFEGFAN